jgi:carbamoyl-phosphate synthase small subunit
MYLHAESVKVDSDEGRFTLEIESEEEDRITINIHGIDLDTFYDQIKACIGPYLRELIDTGLPTFGICLGHQILALASGAKTFKMKFGHHGANHPVKDLDSGRVSITSQNHGFAVDEKTLPSTLRSTHVSLFDGTLQGLARTDKPAFCFQGHPEASPGPHDIGYLFDRFVKLMEKR